MTGDRSRLRNFKKKFIGTVRFGNDHFGAIMGYGDYVIGESVISRVYYVEGLGHNLFSVGQFCDSDLELQEVFLLFLPNLLVVQSLQEQIMVMASTVEPLELQKSKKHTYTPKAENTNLEVLNTLHMDLCGPIEDLGKLQPTADIGIFVGYAPSRKGYRIYNKRTRRIIETIQVQFDELSELLALVQLSTGLAPTFLTPGQIS
ncbi:hypothetical protein Tco_0174329 [Tanacetum coccineum]